jgi:hydrogenase maturation protein HypF
MKSSPLCRLRIVVRGAVQGVGFRPFVFWLATELGLSGWVNNSPQGVCIEVEGARLPLEQFLVRLERERPLHSFIQSLEATWLDAAGYAGFEIRGSDTTGERRTVVLPDIGTCPECLAEILDPANRRFNYAFTNCTHCGPRFSILEALPYDRANTTMRGFTMCDACRAEYEDPRNRRFHAQPNACPVCGPRLEFWDNTGAPVSDPASSTANGRARSETGAPILAAAQAIRDGTIVAVKGIGGFHLMCAAHDEAAVRRLRERKQREEKPFAVMFPSLESIRAECDVNELEARLLGSPEAPIVLLPHHHASRITHHVSPDNPLLGALLPSNPLHHLLLRELGFAVVATSGNLSDEPICTDEREAAARLGGIADFFLVHNRPIVRHVDDSIVRVMVGREQVLRRARGFAPLPLQLRSAECGVRSARGVEQPGKSNIINHKSRIILAVGAHLKNSVALAVEGEVFLSQHIGDLENEPSLNAFQHATGDLPKLFEARPDCVTCDAHPDYLSTKFAMQMGLPRVQVQHHVAHVLSCMAENELEPPVLGVAWDGTGFGLDGTVWGGEFFEVTERGARSAEQPPTWAWQRVAHWRPFALPGGEAAVREPRRAALGLLFAAYGEAAFAMTDLAPVRTFEPKELAAMKQMLMRGLNAPLTSSVGRLFDALAALAGLRQVTRFEGQSAMALEFAAGDTEGIYDLRFTIDEQASQTALQVDWQPMVEAILADVRAGAPAGVVSARFHNTLAEAVVQVARRMGQERVALSGGCFQNRRLLEQAVARLTSAGFRPYWHQRVPPNDGGIALGQAVAVCRGVNSI